MHFQDYLGAIIVFVAIQTSLISSYLLPETSASLVGLALQYTLMIPIYLNWVVKLFADCEMYFGACERISYYIESFYHEPQLLEGCKYTIQRSQWRRSSNVMFFILFMFEDELLPASWPQYGNIEFRNVSLKHPTQTESFIKDLNLIIPAGQRVSYMTYFDF